MGTTNNLQYIKKYLIDLLYCTVHSLLLIYKFRNFDFFINIILHILIIIIEKWILPEEIMNTEQPKHWKWNPENNIKQKKFA